MNQFLRELTPYFPLLVRGVSMTCRLCGVAYLLGIPLGAVLGYLRQRYRGWASLPLQAFSFTMTAVPFLVCLFWLHYPLQKILGVVIQPAITGGAALTLLCTALVADAVYAELHRFPKELLEMARGLGLGNHRIFVTLQVPYLARVTLPQILAVMVMVLHASLFCSFISVEEIFRVAQAINTDLYRPIEIYTIMAAALFAISAIFAGVGNTLKRRWEIK